VTISKFHRAGFLIFGLVLCHVTSLLKSTAHPNTSVPIRILPVAGKLQGKSMGVSWG